MRQRLVAATTSLLLGLSGLTVLLTFTAPPASAAAVAIPVPTQSAGLTNIVGSPDGSIWFVESDAQKIGRMVNGQISEFSLPGGDSAQVKDLDVAADGTAWVVWDSGRTLTHLSPSFAVLKSWSLGEYPYGEQVRVAPDQRAWVTLSYDYDSIAVATDATAYELADAPPCDDSLAIGRDGSVWCRTNNSSITRVNETGPSQAFPAGNFAAWPYALSPGPVGQIWFGRYVSGSFAFSPSDGEVGYLDANGTPVAFNTGSRTAPGDLVQGPDGNMWFTSIGAAKGIGHISPTGTSGALTQIGGYEPDFLTFGTDGFVYATDAQNNVILKVSPAELQVTNVDPGEGSVLTGGAAGGAIAKVKTGKKPIAVKKNAVPLRVACPKEATNGCKGTLRLTTNAKKKAKSVSAKAGYKLKPGKKKSVAIKLNKKGLAALKKGKVVKLRLELYVKGVKQPVSVKVIKVRR